MLGGFSVMRPAGLSGASAPLDLEVGGGDLRQALQADEARLDGSRRGLRQATKMGAIDPRITRSAPPEIPPNSLESLARRCTSLPARATSTALHARVRCPVAALYGRALAHFPHPITISLCHATKPPLRSMCMVRCNCAPT